MASSKIVLFKAENDDKNEDEYVELLKRNDLEVYCLSPIKFKFKNLDELTRRLSEDFHLNYSCLIITSPRIIQILKCLISNRKLTSSSLNKIPFITIGPQTHKRLSDELQITSLIDNHQLNINNAKELANYFNENQLELSKLIDLTKSLFYPTSDLSKEELKTHLNDKLFKIDKLICYETLANDNLDSELDCILKSQLSSREEKSDYDDMIEKEFLFVFFSPSGVKSIKQMVNCANLDRMKLIAIGPTTARSIKEEHKLNLIATLASPTPFCLLETILNYLKHNIFIK